MTGVRLALVLCVAVASCGGKLDRNQLSAQVESLHALAAEAHLLWVNRGAGDTPGAYARVQTDQLVEKIKDAVKALDAGTEPELDPYLRDAQLLGTALESAARFGRGDIGDLEARLAVLDEKVRP